MATTTNSIDEQVHAGQADVLTSDARFRQVACGRRWGKTTTCAKETRDDLLQHGEGWLTWWVAPTYQQAEIGLRTLLDEMPDEYVADVNRSKLRVESVTGALVEFKSADKPDNLRGEGVDKLVVDEAPEVSEYAYENALRPTLTDSETSRMISIGTPKGRNWFHTLFQRGESEDWPGYESFQAPTTENPFINQSDVQAARKELPDRVFRQEYLAEFISETGGVFEQLDDRLFTTDYGTDALPLDPRPRDVAPEDAEQVYAEPPFSIGVDFARHQDYRVAVVVDAHGRVVAFDRDQHETWPEIQRAVERLAERYPGVVVLDASRDNKIVADLERSGCDVDPVKFTSKRKQELIETLIATVEAGELASPEIDVLRHELEVFEYDVTRGGNVQYDAPDGFHDDCVDALALAERGRESAGGAPTASANLDDTDRQRRGTDGDAIREQVAEYQEQYQQAQRSWK